MHEYQGVILIGFKYRKVRVVTIIFAYDYDTTYLKGIQLQLVKKGKHLLRLLLMEINIKLKKVIHQTSETIAAKHYEETRAKYYLFPAKCVYDSRQEKYYLSPVVDLQKKI